MKTTTKPVKLENSDMVLKNVHAQGKCRGSYCTIHWRSDHHMRSWPQVFNPMVIAMERVCEHGIGHTDPDEINNDVVVRFEHDSKCDGCCVPR